MRIILGLFAAFLLFPITCFSQNHDNTYQNLDVVITDGPIIYGTDMNEEDRAKAWGHFFLMMVEACGKQQGKDVLSLKLAKRCPTGEDFCTVMIDANLSGIGGIQEPRKVLLSVMMDAHDVKKQIVRMVCTFPEKDIRVCRDWDTGKLITSSPKIP